MRKIKWGNALCNMDNWTFIQTRLRWFLVRRGGEKGTKILEVDRERFVPELPLNIVKKSCKYFGSDYEGRKNATKSLIHVRHKPPILVDPHTATIIFPTKSPSQPDCIWLISGHIKDHTPEGKKTEVIFSNNQSLVLPISYGSFINQYHKAAALQVAYEINIRRSRMQFLKQQGYRAMEDSGLYWI